MTTTQAPVVDAQTPQAVEHLIRILNDGAIAVLASIGRREIKQVKGIPQTTETAREIPDALRGNEDKR